MSKNEGTIDRVIRAIVGVVALIAALVVGMTSAAGIILAVVAVAMLATAALGHCLLYRPFGICTIPQNKR